MNVNAMLLDALRLMGVGVGMVFAILAIFYGLVKGLMSLFPAQREEGED